MLYYTTDGQLLAMFALGTLGYSVTLPALSLDFIFAKIFQKDTANFKIRRKIFCTLTLNLPTTTIVAQPFNVIKWQLNFNPVA
jgi:hypothetical protein